MNIDNYCDVKTGQDLIDKNVVPKDFPSHLALISYLRLQAIRDKILTGLNDEMLGTWIPINDPDVPLIDGYRLAKGLVADDKLGHKVKFKKDYEGQMKDDWGSNVTIKIPKDTIATLKEYDGKGKKVSIRVDENITGNGNRKNFTLSLERIANDLEASSLGQQVPLDKEAEVMKKTLLEFFPRTVLDTETSRDIIMGLLMGKAMIFYGQPGAGKSEAAKDIIQIAKQREAIFHVEGCQVQCSPYSLFDAKFAQIVPPCPECKINHDPEFKKTGRFKNPEPKDVKVVVAKFSEGKGVEFVEGTTGLNRMHLAGYKMPKIDDGNKDKKPESDYDPEGFHPGVLARTNNGILHTDEMDKLRPQTLDELLEALNSKRIKPDQLRFSYPASSIIVGTANDHTKFSEALNDRMLLLGIFYPDDGDTSYEITRRAYHQEWKEASEVKLEDTQTKEPLHLRSVFMPTIMERAVDAVYIKFRKEYAGKGRNNVSASNRSKIDALDAARAELFIDKLFYKYAPETVDASYAIKGIQFAFYARIQEPQKETELEGHKELDAWVAKEFPGVLKKEEDVWWCRLYKEIAVAKTQIPEIEGNFNAELDRYAKNTEDALEAFDKVKHAYESSASHRDQRARIEYPFMDYLFKEQPRFETANEHEVVELVKYFIKSREGVSCPLPSSTK